MKWISCSERLPETEEYVAVAIKIFDVFSDSPKTGWARSFYSQTQKKWESTFVLCGQITHWMKVELPED